MSKTQIESFGVKIDSGTYECMVDGPDVEVTDSSGSKVITTPTEDFKENLSNAVSLQNSL
jgi:hypothetical protein